MDDLPPANLNALGLHLTDAQFEGLLAFVRQQSRIGRAWVYGSRRSGRRRQKATSIPPDVDLAVEFAGVEPTDETLAMFDVRWAAAEFFVHSHPEYGLTTEAGKPHAVQIEFPGIESAKVAGFIDAEGATLIFDRSRESDG